jgi:S-formylglutathione hydrolase FrmB
MPPRKGSSRTQLWLEGLGDWSWPGSWSSEELLPPAWVPTLPRSEPVLAVGALPARPHAVRSRAWRLALGALLSALAAASVSTALGGASALDELPTGSASTSTPPRPTAIAPPPTLVSLPPLERVGSDAAGSSIERAAWYSPSLQSQGSFFAYLPPGYTSTLSRYPVLYLLHGRNGHAIAFLEMGIQETLDRLIAEQAIAPMIVVMIQDRPGLNNWRDLGTRHSETYVIEVQELVDRMFRTIPERSARAIAGSSMGGFGAMNVALANPLRFAVVESWLGFFNNLEVSLQAERPVIERLGMYAFLYGAAADPVAVPAEDPEFASELRAAGAQASSAIYPGGHSLEKIKEHLDTGLVFAGRSLEEARRHAQAELAAPRGGANRTPFQPSATPGSLAEKALE